jgi:hypothetical protein
VIAVPAELVHGMKLSGAPDPSQRPANGVADKAGDIPAGPRTHALVTRSSREFRQLNADAGVGVANLIRRSRRGIVMGLSRVSTG